MPANPQFAPIAALVLLAAGAAQGQAPTPVAAPATIVTQPVYATVETAAVASAEDAADDPAIWRNPANPGASLIVATDKQAGLYVYGLDGKTRSLLAAGKVNNVDLRDGVALGAQRDAVLVGASNRTDLTQGKIALFRLDTDKATLAPLADLPVAAGEAYGFCFWRRAADRAMFAFLIMKDGAIVQAQLDLTGPTPTAKVVRTVKLATQSEGCVADDRTGMVYVAEEDVGVWSMPADPASLAPPKAFARVDNVHLFADAEGLAIAPEGGHGGHLIVSSQGDSAYSAYRLTDGVFTGRFKVAKGTLGDTSDTDGIEVALGDFGNAFPQGLFIAQDGDNAPKAQNFKLVRWDRIAAAFGL